MKKVITIAASLIFLATSCKKEEVTPTSNESEVKSYTNFKITSVVVNTIPFNDNDGGSWDISSGPDLYFKLIDGNSTLYSKGTVYNDISSQSLPLGWNLPKAFEINNINTTYFIELYDHDDIDSDDYIGYVSFLPYLYSDSYPSSIVLEKNGSKVLVNGIWY